MFEKRRHKLLPKKRFILRILRTICLALLLISVALGLGMWGYHTFENLPWIDAYVNAAMILSGMGPLLNPTTWVGKFFAGSFALFSGLVFIAIIAVIMAPILHRAIHKFHIEEEKDKN